MFKTWKAYLTAIALCSTFGTHLSHAASEDEVKSLARLYSAAFDRNPDIGGLNFWVDTFDNGRSIREIAVRFNRSPEFIETYGVLSNRAYVEQLYRNVLGREGEEDGIAFFTTGLNVGSTNLSSVLANFASSPENKTKTGTLFNTVSQRADGDWGFDIDGDGGFDNIGALWWNFTSWDKSKWQ
jgi:hypothetical protein